MKIYVVRGTKGEYSDRYEWLVKAFICEELAKKLVLEADAAVREKASQRIRRLYDQNEPTGSDPASYYLEEIELDETPF